MHLLFYPHNFTHLSQLAVCSACAVYPSSCSEPSHKRAGRKRKEPMKQTKRTILSNYPRPHLPYHELLERFGDSIGVVEEHLVHLGLVLDDLGVDVLLAGVRSVSLDQVDRDGLALRQHKGPVHKGGHGLPGVDLKRKKKSSKS